MTWLLANWRVVAGVAIVIAVLTASYAKGRADANANWEAKYQQALIDREKRGRVATRKAVEGLKDDIESIRNRPGPPVVRLCPKPVSQPAGGTAYPATDGQPTPVGAGDEAGKLVGRITADILDEADLDASRCARLIEWVRANQ